MPRRRRTRDEARRAILAAAERRLVAEGPASIRVQKLARELGLSDAALHYHFGSQRGLLEALLRHAGRQLKDRLTAAIAAWDRDGFEIARLIELFADTYAERGYARVAAWLVLAGWQPHGAGMLRGVADAIHARRRRDARAAGVSPPPLEDTLHALTLVNLAIFAEALAGGPFRRAVGLPADRATARRFRRWLTDLVETRLR